MSVIDAIVAALAKYAPAVGEWPGDATGNHVSIIPLYDEAFEADNEDWVIDAYIDIHFFVAGDYQPARRSARKALNEAGVAVVDTRYIECLDNQHHFVLSVVGRDEEGEQENG